MQQRNIQILLETITKCAGNCSGCALSSTERMDTAFDFENFYQKTQQLKAQLVQENVHEIESLTVFLGQGDHFMMKNDEIEPFVKACAQMIPDSLKMKTVVFITASAIGKHEQIRQKMDLFYDYSVAYGLPFFIQVVFDPKKMNLNDKFANIYIQNILYFKEKCGMTEVTVNMGEDLYEHMTPSDFHQWIKTYQFKHIEMNWVTNKMTLPMWKKSYLKMYEWLKNWLEIYSAEPVYEINFLPFLARHLKLKTKPLMKVSEDIIHSLKNNTYIDYMGHHFVSQLGLISNLTPFGERLGNMSMDAEQQSKHIIRTLSRRASCAECEYKSVCAVSGVVANFNSSMEELEHCPWGVKDFLIFIEKLLQSSLIQDKTVFDKNPVQNASLEKENNALHHYFEQAFQTIKTSETKIRRKKVIPIIESKL